MLNQSKWLKQMSALICGFLKTISLQNASTKISLKHSKTKVFPFDYKHNSF